MKIDADQLYFSQDLKELRDSIVNGVHQNGLARLCGKVVNVFCQKRGSKRIWSKWHLMHWLQYIVVPLLRKQYVDFAVSEFLKGNGYLSLSGINVLQYNNRWCSLLGCKWEGGVWWPYMGTGDHLVFKADERTEYLPWDYMNGSGKKMLIERFVSPNEKTDFLIGIGYSKITDRIMR